ncbi:MAG: hypothetical protein IKT71_03385 [Paludibacteraceae bacterium]|nr:hypothetical protein [Paludibacteraceae bacterium]
MNNLIQTITDYTTVLEQKLSALEARVAQLEEANEAMRHEGDEAKALIATLQAEVAALAAAGVVAAHSKEPEVEIELIIEEDTETANGEVKTENELVEELQEQETIEEPVEESTEIPQEVPAEEMPLEILEEPKVEEYMAKSVAEPVTSEPAPAPRPTPTQTSLFGSAVEDIRQAISLGDRFLFQRELFAGNGELMQKTLDEINSLNSLSEAMDYVLDNFEWDKESTAVQLFENVLKRRFS